MKESIMAPAADSARYCGQWRVFLGALCLSLFLAGCAAGGAASAPVKGAPSARHTGAREAAPPAVTRPVRPSPGVEGWRSAKVHMLPGLEEVIGARSGQLTRQFGKPRLDVWEDDSRKLQYGNNVCILDIYLYPDAPGAEPRATYAEARSAIDGKAMDSSKCVTSMRETPR